MGFSTYLLSLGGPLVYNFVAKNAGGMPCDRAVRANMNHVFKRYKDGIFEFPNYSKT
jgi:hypothetical protein